MCNRDRGNKKKIKKFLWKGGMQTMGKYSAYKKTSYDAVK